MQSFNHSTEKSNVLVIGSGGAGLRAAIEAKQRGVEVTVLGKRAKKDVHTVLAAGGINAALGNLDTQDSWEEHFADTYLEGYGIGDPDIIQLMTKEAPALVKEIDLWGADFAKLKNGSLDQRFFGAHRYRRTCYSGDFTGQSILNTLLKKASLLKIPIFDFHYVTSLLIHNGVCFGAMSIDMKTSQRTVHLADAVILCTGGHTRIWKKSSSRKDENTGDGYYLALKSGCELTDMEMVQFHPTGMVLPKEIEGTLVTEAVRGEGGKLFNNKGERFMANYDKERMELSTRDKVAMANYREIIEGRGTINGGVLLDISHKDKEFILEKIPRIYKQFLDYQRLDISKEPMEVAPTAHYSMGGVVVSAESHATNIEGLYAAGEVTGGLHGANRLGGNSLAEILIFGKRAGKAASTYSKNVVSQATLNKPIKEAHENINQLIRKGTESSAQLQVELRDLMWVHCGVIKKKSSLELGLNKLYDLKSVAENINIPNENKQSKDLLLKFDFKASLISAEATLLSALKREESRGAHQRADYPNINHQKNINYHIKITENKLTIHSHKVKPLNKNLQITINKVNKVKNFKGKLIE